MPTVLQMRFPARRYHATPWAHHVNEGVVEWPPSPWRLLRALLATGFTKCGWDPARPPELARRLVESLAAVTPSFALPPASLGHSRHYVEAAAKKPLVLDTWARVEDDAPPVEVCWPCELDGAQHELLAVLANLVGYLGRAESWVDVRLVDAPALAPNCSASDGTPPGPGWEPVRVLCPQPAPDYAAWRAEATRRIDEELPLPAGKRPPAKLLKDRAKALAPFPGDLVEALCVETGWLQDQGWSSAPGSREVVYWRRADALEVGRPRPAQPRPLPAVPFALLSVSTGSRNRSALPMDKRVFAQGRLLHKALAAKADRSGPGEHITALLGRDQGQTDRHGHRHAHLLHLDLDGDQHLDHVLLWCPSGLDAVALQVVRSVRRTWMKGGVGELQVALVATGDAQTLRDLDEVFQGRVSAVLGPPGGAARWRSATPYLAPRYTKKNGKDSLVGQIQAALERRGLPPAEVEILPRELPFRHFVLHDADRRPPMSVPHALRLTFPEPIQGPLCLGYGSHYGLGRFAADLSEL
jgi:CRISPR-associated protein Csb2